MTARDDGVEVVPSVASMSRCGDINTKPAQLWEFSSLSPGQVIRPINLRGFLSVRIINMVLIYGYLLSHCDDGGGHPTVIPPWPLSADCCQALLVGARGICQVLSSGERGRTMQLQSNHCYVYLVFACYALLAFTLDLDLTKLIYRMLIRFICIRHHDPNK